MKFYKKDPRKLFLTRFKLTKDGFAWTKQIKRGVFRHSTGSRLTPYKPVSPEPFNDPKYNPALRLICQQYQHKKLDGNKSKTAFLFIHGYAESQFRLHELWYFRLFSGIFDSDVYALELPYHHNREPVDSPFSGAYFLNGNPVRMLEAFRQSIQEILFLVNYLQERYERVVLFGISLGGHLVALASQFVENTGVIAALASPFLFKIASRINIAPVSNEIVADLRDKGFASWYKILYPCNLKYFAMPEYTTNRNTAIIGGMYDRIVPLTSVQELASLLEKPLFSYPGGHLSLFPWLSRLLHQVKECFENND
ncbi:MAG: alpha/beta hydrolase [Candidatus Odinarchaeota archaeon]